MSRLEVHLQTGQVQSVLVKEIGKRIDVELGAVAAGAGNDRINVGNGFRDQFRQFGKPLLQAGRSEEFERDGLFGVGFQNVCLAPRGTSTTPRGPTSTVVSSARQLIRWVLRRSDWGSR